jgi:hypothetical protein
MGRVDNSSPCRRSVVQAAIADAFRGRADVALVTERALL